MPTCSRRYLMYISQNYSYAMLRPLQSVILEQGGQVRWFLEGNEVNDQYLTEHEVQLTSIKEVKQYNPDAVFVPGNVVPSFIPGVKVGVFHGFNSGKRGDNHFKIRGCFDLYCTQGPQTTEKFKELEKKHGFFTTVETGWPTLDPLFKSNQPNPYVNERDSRPTVLMCSTFSKDLSCAPHLFEQVQRMSQLGKWRWLVQFHPKMPQEWVNKYKSLESKNLTFVETDNVLPLLQAADVMLCDTSSVLLMFAIQNKPVVTFRNQQPMPHLLNILDPEDVENALSQAIQRPPTLMKEVREYANYIHPYTDGQSSMRVLEATNQLIDSGTSTPKSKPWNLVRMYKLRKKLNYWRL